MAIERPKILHLTLKKKWFDMVGNPKTEEYREDAAWIRSRLMHQNGTRKHYDVVQFRNGYSLDAPKKTFKFEGFKFGIGKKEWGASGTHQYIIKLGEQITTGRPESV